MKIYSNVYKYKYHLLYIVMIIPVKCFTCGCVLADKYRYFQDRVRKLKMQDEKYRSRFIDGQYTDKIEYFTKNNMEKTPEGKVLDELKLYNVCCRRHMLTHVDIV
jgi:DNA-directed RNA polymerase subunit N (RpoN/RPB10)